MTFTRINENDSGIILLVVLGVLVVLSFLAVTLSRRTHVDLTLAKFAISKTKADFAARAGIQYALNLIEEDTQSEQWKDVDTLGYCGIPGDKNMDREKILADRELEEGTFSLIVPTEENSSTDKIYGIQDESGKININSLQSKDKNVFFHLLMLVNVPEDLASKIASGVIGQTQETSDGVTRRSVFDSKQEILTVYGMTPDIYKAIEPYFTVYPKTQIWFSFNINTAPRIVLQALARAAIIEEATKEDADSLVEKIITFRAGPDGKEYTSDDRPIDNNGDMALNAKESAIFSNMTGNGQRVDKTNYLMITSEGQDLDKKAVSRIQAVVARENLSILYWHHE